MVRASAPGGAFSPRMWGCSALIIEEFVGLLVFPTHVGMFRRDNVRSPFLPSFPHACGDVPDDGGQPFALDLFSPRMWGCSGTLRRVDFTNKVFPTHVGMFRSWRSRPLPRARFPHACGDVP